MPEHIHLFIRMKPNQSIAYIVSQLKGYTSYYTSQLCSYCGIIGSRNGENFICKNNRCGHCKKIQNSDINAAFNICKRVNEPGGISNT